LRAVRADRRRRSPIQPAAPTAARPAKTGNRLTSLSFAAPLRRGRNAPLTRGLKRANHLVGFVTPREIKDFTGAWIPFDRGVR
jgi:hypothetical protein